MARNDLICIASLLLSACPVPPVAEHPCDIDGEPGLIDGRTVHPFPSSHLLAPADSATGCHMSVDSSELPIGEGDPLPVNRVAHLDGFSPIGTIWLQPGAAVDGSALPGPYDLARSVAADAPIKLWDLETGDRLPYFAEVDAFPDQADEDRSLLIRPVAHMGWGRWIGVSISGLPTLDGGTWEAPEAFAALRDGRSDGSDELVGHYERILQRLAELGEDRPALTLAWDFRTATKAPTTAPLDTVLEAMRLALPLDPTHQPAVTIDEVREAGGALPPASARLWREIRGSVTLPHFLWDPDAGDDHDAGWFEPGEGGRPIPNGAGQAYFVLVVPESLRGRPAGSAPWLVFGHGIFSSPANYVADPQDPSAVVELLNRLGAIGIGTEWRGLTTRDAPDAVRVATNIGRFPLLTDKLSQGVANQAAMARLARTAFVGQDFLQAEDGGSLVDPERVLYHGISLGGIEGATLFANSEVLDAAALHVPGSTWATMLERSWHWGTFEEFVQDAMPDPAERQLTYAWSQLLWDPVDPMEHHEALMGRSVLWQVSQGDEQVPDFTAAALARSVGATLMVPSPWEPWGLATAEAPLGPGQPTLTVFDGGFPDPSPDNRPAEESGAHDGIRRTPQVVDQLEAFFEPGAEGTVINPCGGPCVIDPA